MLILPQKAQPQITRQMFALRTVIILSFWILLVMASAVEKEMEITLFTTKDRKFHLVAHLVPLQMPLLGMDVE